MSAYTTPPALPVPRFDLPVGIWKTLKSLIRRDLQTRLLKFPCLVASLLPGFWLFQGTLDLVFNLSWGTRVGFLVASVVLVGWLFYRHVVFPVRGRLNLRSAALLVERAFPRFRSSLISAVDFAGVSEGISHQSAGLVPLVFQQAERLLEQTQVPRVIDLRGVQRLAAAALLACAFLGALLWHFQPQSLVLLRRVFLSQETLPTRTTVEALTTDLTLNVGSDVELAARARGVVPKNGKLEIVYADGRSSTIPVAVSSVEPDVFRVTIRNVLQPFRYHFQINDGTGPEFQVKIRVLPSLARIRFTCLPPSYTGRPATELPPGGLTLLAESRLIIEGEATQPLESAMLELKGKDQILRMDNGDPAANLRHRIEANERRIEELQSQQNKIRPELETANVEQEKTRLAAEEAKRLLDATPEGDQRRKRGWEFEKAANAERDARGIAERVRVGWEQLQRQLEGVQTETAAQRAQLNQTLPPPDEATRLRQKQMLRAEISIPHEGLTGLTVHLKNEEGLASENDPIYRVNVTADKPPVIEITDPRAETKTVLPEDKIGLGFRARDDYKIERIQLHYVVLRPNAEGEATPSEVQKLPISFPPDATTVTGGQLFDLAAISPPLTEGCTVTVWFEAADHYTLYSPGAGVTRKLNLKVVSPEEKKAELIAEMEKAAKEIDRLSERQRRINEKTDATLRR